MTWLPVARAAAAYRDGHYEEAIALAQRVQPVDLAQASTIAALSLAKLGRVDEAIELLKSVMHRSGPGARLSHRLCDLELRRGHLLSAQRWLAQAPREESEEAERRALNVRIAHGYRKLPNVAAELALFNSGGASIALRRDLAAAFQGARAHSQAWEIARGLPMSQHADQTVELASLAAQAGDGAAARSYLQHALTLRPNAKVLEQASRVSFEIGDVDAAFALAEQAASLGRHFAWLAQLQLFGGAVSDAAKLAAQHSLSNLLAAVALVEGRFSEVLALLGPQPPREPELAVTYGEALRCLNRVDEADKAFQSARSGAQAEILALRVNALLLRSAQDQAMRETWRSIAPIAGLAAEPCPQDVRPAAEAVLRAFSGNRSASASYLDATGKLCRHFGPASLRHRVAHLQNLVQVLPFDQVLKEYDALAAEVGEEPLILTYRAELQLWWGRYAAAARDCERACAIQPTTRWAWLGLAGCALFSGDLEEAERRLVRFSDSFLHLDNSHVYWGELRYRQQRFDEAEAALTRAIVAHPSRIAAWVLHVGVAAARRDRDGVRQRLAELEQRAAPLLRDVRSETNLSHNPEPGEARSAMDHALGMLRGNRSSGLVVYFTRDGQAHRART